MSLEIKNPDTNSEMTDEQTITVGDTTDGQPYQLPVEDVLTGRAFATGKSGAGKSNTGSVIAEELLTRGHPLLIVDTDGEYWGLKEEYEILHVGATDECDLQVGPEHAGKLAELALDQHIPIILDVSGYVDGDTSDDLVRETARELFAREQQAMQPFLMLVEEIHEYIPQQGGLDEAGKMLIRVAKRGRKRGLGIMGLSQRPADVKKDFITQADLLVWHRLTWDNDTDVVKRVVGSEYGNEVQDLADGEAFVQADWSEMDVERVQFRRKHTFDAGATPGLDDVARPELKSIGEDLVEDLDEISAREERRRDRVSELEAQLAEKDARIDDLEQELENKEDIANAAQQMAAALQQGADGDRADEVPGDWEETLEAKNERIHDLQEDLAAVREERDELRERAEAAESEAERLASYQERVEQAEAIEEQLAKAREVLGVEGVAEAGQPGADDGDNSELRAELNQREETIAELEAKIDRLRDAAESGEGVEPLDSYQEFLEDDDVRAVIEEAKNEDYPSEKYHKGILAAILANGGPVSYEEVADRLGASRTNEVSSAATTLESFNVVEKEKRNGETLVDLNVDGLQEIREAAKRRRQTESLMDGL
jgi:biotin operon repressor